MVYRFRDGFRAGPLDAQAVGDHLSALAGRDPLTPERVLDDARDPSAPTHAAFEWDDQRAAHEHRLSQARRLIGAVVTVVPSREGEKEFRAFLHVETPEDDLLTEDRRQYVSTEQAAATPAYRQQVLDRLLAEAHAWAERARVFGELAEAVDAMVAALPPDPRPAARMRRRGAAQAAVR